MEPVFPGLAQTFRETPAPGGLLERCALLGTSGTLGGRENKTHFRGSQGKAGPFEQIQKEKP